jgi:hypothetical protein
MKTIPKFLASIAATTGLAASALVSGAPLTGAQPTAEPLQIWPSSGPIGTAVDLGGTGCVGPAGPGVVTLSYGGLLVDIGDSSGDVVAHPDGGWTTNVRLVDGGPAGTYQFTATCIVNDGSGTVIAEYGPTPFELTDPADPIDAAGPADPVVAEPTFTG